MMYEYFIISLFNERRPEKRNSRIKRVPLKRDWVLSFDMTVTLSTREIYVLVTHASITETHSTRTLASTQLQHNHLSSQPVNLDPGLHTAIKIIKKRKHFPRDQCNKPITALQRPCFLAFTLSVSVTLHFHAINFSRERDLFATPFYISTYLKVLSCFCLPYLLRTVCVRAY